MKTAAFGMWLACTACAACACSGDSSKSTPPGAGETTNPSSGAAPAAPSSTARDPAAPTPAAPAAGLCVELDDIDVEPMDLEALEDEAPAVDVPAPVAQLIDAAVAAGPVLERKASAGAGAFVVPLFRCSGEACVAGLVTIDGQGRESGITPLPGAESPSPGTHVRLTAARADVNSDGQVELWVGYQVGNPASEPSTHHLAAFTWPALDLLWHRPVSRTAPAGTDRACDGALHPIDADCDGDGDLVLIERCAEARCLNDDSEGCARPEERITTFLWDAPAKTYRETSGR